MKRLSLLLTALLPGALLSGVAPARAADQPNFLFILVDDFGARDLSAYGSVVYDTPQLDRLAASGAKFTQAYVAYPRCVPSRFAIFTGKHPAAVQGDRDSPHVEPERDATMGEAFQAGGYATFYCGKWHLGDGPSRPERVGFASSVAAGAAGAARSHFAPYNVARGKSGEGEKHGIDGLDDAPADEYLTDRLTQETMEFIEANRERPFFAVLAHYAVHTPIEAKRHLTKRYQEKIDALPKPAAEWERESAGENRLVQDNATYAAMIQSVDHGVGRLLGLLDRLDLASRTIVILASDHGGLSTRGNQREVATSNRPFRAGKGHLYEGGLRIPLVIRWPGTIRPGTEIATPVSTLDLFPTFVSMAGLAMPGRGGRDGVDLVPLLKEGRAPARDTFHWHNPAPRPASTGDWFSSAIRKGDLKLLDFPTEKKVELYDLAADPGETKDLSDSRPGDRDRLLAELNAWRTQVGARAEPKSAKADRQSSPDQNEP